MNNVSDGYHTFDELYYHRGLLFSLVCNQIMKYHGSLENTQMVQCIMECSLQG